MTNLVEHNVMYGAGAGKLARILGIPEKQGGRIKKEFYEAHPAIEALITDLSNAYSRKGYINGFDGRPLFIRSEHKLLNSLLQNAACIVFKAWMVECESRRNSVAGFKDKVRQMIAYHDELQFQVKGTEVTAAVWGQVVCDAALTVGKVLNIEVPIEAEAKIGKNWADCH